VQIKVFNSSGEEVVLLAQDLPCYQQPSGLKTVTADFVPDAGGQGSVALLGPGTVIAWDGRTGGGQEVSSGAYVIQAVIQDSFGHTSSFTTTLTVVRQDLDVHVEIYDSAGELVRHFTDVAASAGSSGVSLSSSDLVPGGSLQIHYGSGSGDLVTWDGSGDNGRQVQSGTYLVKVTRHTGKGQVEVFTSSVTVLQTGADGSLNQVIIPNPFPAGGTLILPLGALSTSRVRADIYDLAGEKVASLDNGGSAGALVWDTGRHAPGIYFIRLTLQDSLGRLSFRLAKISLL
jgi:flagellar hook assembly protein FlgD